MIKLLTFVASQIFMWSCEPTVASGYQALDRFSQSNRVFIGRANRVELETTYIKYSESYKVPLVKTQSARFLVTDAFKGVSSGEFVETESSLLEGIGYPVFAGESYLIYLERANGAGGLSWCGEGIIPIHRATEQITELQKLLAANKLLQPTGFAGG